MPYPVCEVYSAALLVLPPLSLTMHARCRQSLYCEPSNMPFAGVVISFLFPPGGCALLLHQLEPGSIS